MHVNKTHIHTHKSDDTWSPCRGPRGHQSWQCRRFCSSSLSFWTACCTAPVHFRKFLTEVFEMYEFRWFCEDLDKYVDDCEVALGVVVDLWFDGEGQGFVVQPLPFIQFDFNLSKINLIWFQLSSKIVKDQDDRHSPAPPIVFAVSEKIWKKLKSGAKLWKVRSQWNSLQVVKFFNLLQKMCFKLVTFSFLQVFESSFFPRMQNSSLSCVHILTIQLRYWYRHYLHMHIYITVDICIDIAILIFVVVISW